MSDERAHICQKAFGCVICSSRLRLRGASILDEMDGDEHHGACASIAGARRRILLGSLGRECPLG